MNQKTYLQVTGTLFTLAALVHISRLMTNWPVSVNSMNLPVFGSVVIAAISAYLAYSAFKLMK